MSSSDAASSATRAELGVAKPGSLLLVDDEKNVRDSLRRVLRNDGYQIFTAPNGPEALALLAEKPVDVVLSDQQMPGMCGTDLLRQVMELYPGTVRMILSGAADIEAVSDAMRAGIISKFLTKPIDSLLLRANVHEAFSRVDASHRRDDLPASRADRHSVQVQDGRNAPLGELAEAVRHRADGYCVIMLRADQYQSVIGSFGYAFGREFLGSVAAALNAACAPTESLLEMSAGSYVLVTSAAGADARIRELEVTLEKSFMNPLEIRGHSIRVTFSIGGAIGANAAASLEEVVEHAHAALIAAMQSGGGAVEMYRQTLVTEFREQLRLEADLRKAVNEWSLAVFYQPQVRVGTGAIEGVEALVRWLHPELGFISPARFIPTAERIGLIGAIGENVLRVALTQLSQWSACGLAPTEMSVNVSPLQLQSGRLDEVVAACLEEASIEPCRLVLEVTENVAIANDARVSSTLGRLRDIGVQLAIDDFGIGYANMGHLSASTFSKLKIDRSLVPQTSGGRSQTIFRNIVDMARSLDLVTVAEGVETSTEFGNVTDCGCELVQGYFFSPPVNAVQLGELLHLGADGLAGAESAEASAALVGRGRIGNA